MIKSTCALLEETSALSRATDVKAVWSHLLRSGVAKLVTVHFIDRGQPMRIPGERIKRTRLVQTDKFVVAVEVEMVFPVDDPSEPCYESETVEHLRDVKERAERGDVAWLTKQGKIYRAMEPV